jgi:hypothetical protein
MGPWKINIVFCFKFSYIIIILLLKGKFSMQQVPYPVEHNLAEQRARQVRDAFPKLSEGQAERIALVIVREGLPPPAANQMIVSALTSEAA